MANRKNTKGWDKYCIITNPKWSWEECPVSRDYPAEPGERWFRNGYYQVFITPIGKEMVHLSIKTHDRRPSRDWRDFQQIKNDLVGAECEGVELFPAESRLVDTANQYHMWAVKDPEVRFPLGFNEGRVVSNDTHSGAIQRPNPKFEEEKA